MSVISILTWIEIKAYLRNWGAIFWTFIYPVALLILLSLMFGGDKGYTARIEVVQAAGNPVAEEYIEALHDRMDMIPGLSVHTVWLDDATLPQAAVIRLSFSPDFGRDNAPSAIGVEVLGEVDANLGGVLALLGELTEVFNRVKTGASQQFFVDYGQINSSSGNGYNYNAFLVSGLTALTVISTAMFGFTTVLVEMRQNGALKMFQIFPMRRGHFITSFVLSRTLVLALFCIAFFYLANVALQTGVSITGQSIAGFVLLLLLGIITFLGVGLLLVSLIKKGSTAIAIINIVNLPIIFLSDLFIPVASMPAAIRDIAELSPVYLFVNAMRSVTQPEFVLNAIVPTVLTLIGISLVSFMISSKSFQWRTI
ncbi:ABC transporter permease [Alkalimonas collagenimarina]|uniref:ABC transporter permease n=1 Tax=Alkalimonas collagenimarina TaxID=400390 RepID=A0ABT9GVQ4_9GAMM|nr:ABC transporter permease [Alkalimonas collagenimarina]MDP4535121.1 ABC transporter permease [Alkalimonas collagenimarina]